MIREFNDILPQGTHLFTWDLLDDRGRSASCGLKLIMLKIDGKVSAVEKIVLLK